MRDKKNLRAQRSAESRLISVKIPQPRESDPLQHGIPFSEIGESHLEEAKWCEPGSSAVGGMMIDFSEE
jgi:hypothetical protein